MNPISRRDDLLERTRRLTARITAGAFAASIGLAAALGSALPGHSVRATGSTTSAPGTHGGGRTRTLNPPPQAPAPAPNPAAPVVTSGGS